VQRPAVVVTVEQRAPELEKKKEEEKKKAARAAYPVTSDRQGTSSP